MIHRLSITSPLKIAPIRTKSSDHDEKLTNESLDSAALIINTGNFDPNKDRVQRLHEIDGVTVMTMPDCKHCVNLANVIVDLEAKFEFENLTSLAKARVENKKPFFLIATLSADQKKEHPLINYYQGSSIIHHWYNSIKRKTENLIDPNTRLNTESIQYYLLPRTNARADYLGQSNLLDVKNNAMQPLIRLSVAAETANSEQSDAYSLIYALMYLHGSQKLFPEHIFEGTFNTISPSDENIDVGNNALESLLSGKDLEEQKSLFKQAQEELCNVMVPHRGDFKNRIDSYREYLAKLDIWDL